MFADDMTEIRWHGRGGQGAVTAAKLLAEAGLLSGWKGVTSAPSFGAERRGAPVTASTRLADVPIRVMSQVTEPDVVVVLDDSLLAVAHATAGIKPGGVIIVNTTRSTAELGLAGDFRVITSDVTGAAEEAGVTVGGQAMVNTAVLGSVARATDLVTLETVEMAITGAFAPTEATKNIEAAQIAYRCTSLSISL